MSRHTPNMMSQAVQQAQETIHSYNMADLRENDKAFRVWNERGLSPTAIEDYDASFESDDDDTSPAWSDSIEQPQSTQHGYIPASREVQEYAAKVERVYDAREIEQAGENIIKIREEYMQAAYAGLPDLARNHFELAA